MNILLTGATGFLGQYVLEQLLKESSIHTIYLLARNPKNLKYRGDDFNLKCKIIAADLSRDKDLKNIPAKIDGVIHLAGQYDFNKSETTDYLNNVVATENLVSQLKKRSKSRQKPWLIFASTYVVAPNEDRVSRFDLYQTSYAKTKALAEKIVLESGLKTIILRFGIIVGSTDFRPMPKQDGPYALMGFLDRLAVLPLPPKWLVLPASNTGILPLVPVDSAARVVTQCVRLQVPKLGPRPLIFGVYNKKSVNTRSLCHFLVKQRLPKCKIVFISRCPRPVISGLSKVLRIPVGSLNEALANPKLHNQQFVETFGNEIIPDFSQYKAIFKVGKKNEKTKKTTSYQSIKRVRTK